MSADILVVIRKKCATGLKYVKGRHAVKHPTVYRTAPSNKQLSGLQCQSMWVLRNPGLRERWPHSNSISRLDGYVGKLFFWRDWFNNKHTIHSRPIK